MDILVRQAHPGPGARPYRSLEAKIRDAGEFQQTEGIPWPVLADDVEGTVHRTYGGLSDPSYLIDRDGRVAYYNMWTHVPTLDAAIEALMRQGGCGVVGDGIDRTPHMLPALTAGWRAIRRGLPQSFTDLMTAAPGSPVALWLARGLRPVLAPIALRARPLPLAARLGLAAGGLAAAAAIALGVRRALKR